MLPQKSGQVRQWWNQWFVPYVVLTVSPVITLSASAVIFTLLPYCLDDERGYRLRDFEIALAPSVADLLPFLWLASRMPRVRSAAVVAGLIGLVRFAIPQIFTLMATIPADPHLLAPPEPPGPCEGYPISTFTAVGVGYIMPVLWLVSALISGLIVAVTARRRQPPA